MSLEAEDRALTPEEIAEQKIAALEAKITTRRDNHRAEYLVQYAIDLEALDELESSADNPGELTNVSIAGEKGRRYTPGLPTLAIFRRPSEALIKRYRYKVKPKHERDKPDVEAATVELAQACLAYPTAEVFAEMCVARPGVGTQCGLACVNLAIGSAESDVKG